LKSDVYISLKMNPLQQLHAYGQSFWYDNIERRLLRDGSLQAMIDNDGLRGLTSNPTIFQKAVGESSDYDEQIQQLARDSGHINAIYEALALADIQAACDLFRALYEESDRGDGFVSLEVSPHLALDSEGTVQEARRLFTAVDRPNLMIKVPATPAGIPAIRRLIGEGINVNVTLMFSMAHYEAVARAYMEGLQHWLDQGGEPRSVASVASFFVSRVDTAVDKKLAALDNPAAQPLMGQAAIANSRLVYGRFKELFHGKAFEALRAAGAPVQRLLWASTGAKNPAYRDTLYIDELIGPQTVTTMPPQTVDAFRDHGRVAPTLEQGLDQARLLMEFLAELGIDMDQITEQLQEEGVRAFAASFDDLMATIAAKSAALRPSA
jgi:transaldolase